MNNKIRAMIYSSQLGSNKYDQELFIVNIYYISNNTDALRSGDRVGTQTVIQIRANNELGRGTVIGFWGQGKVLTKFVINDFSTNQFLTYCHIDSVLSCTNIYIKIYKRGNLGFNIPLNLLNLQCYMTNMNAHSGEVSIP